MNIIVGVGEYILQTHNTNFFEDSMGGLNPSNLPSSLGTPVGVVFEYSVAEVQKTDTASHESLKCNRPAPIASAQLAF